MIGEETFMKPEGNFVNLLACESHVSRYPHFVTDDELSDTLADLFHISSRVPSQDNRIVLYEFDTIGLDQPVDWV